MALIKLTDSQKKWNRNIIIIMVLGILYIANANPTSETFYCDESKCCTLTQSYVLPLLNNTKKYELNDNASLKTIEHYYIDIKNNQFCSLYKYYLGLDNGNGKTIKLFKRKEAEGRISDRSRIKELIFKNTIKQFDNYKNNPNLKFYTTSKAKKDDFKFWFNAWIIFMTVLMAWNTFDRNKG